MSRFLDDNQTLLEKYCDNDFLEESADFDDLN